MYLKLFGIVVLNAPIFHYSLILDADRLLMMTDEILTLKEVAGYLKLAEKTAYRLAAEGKLPGFKVGGSWRFKRVDIEQWIENSKKNGSRGE